MDEVIGIWSWLTSGLWLDGECRRGYPRTVEARVTETPGWESTRNIWEVADCSLSDWRGGLIHVMK